MIVKDLVRPIPGVRQLSRLRQQLGFSGSARYWELNYEQGGSSGPGSYGDLGQGKAEFLNGFVRDCNVESVIEFGCGDGHQLSLAKYPHYVGLDVSRAAIRMCKRRFADDPTKSFFLYEGDAFVDRMGLFAADVSISLDVVYHLIEDQVFEAYMKHLFAAGKRYVVVYSTNKEIRDDAPHVRHRQFSLWVEENCSQWGLIDVVRGPSSPPRRADFFVYERENADSPDR
jgi:SAM-dependent methyltransferase